MLPTGARSSISCRSMAYHCELRFIFLLYFFFNLALAKPSRGVKQKQDVHQETLSLAVLCSSFDEKTFGIWFKQQNSRCCSIYANLCSCSCTLSISGAFFLLTASSRFFTQLLLKGRSGDGDHGKLKLCSVSLHSVCLLSSHSPGQGLQLKKKLRIVLVTVNRWNKI